MCCVALGNGRLPLILHCLCCKLGPTPTTCSFILGYGEVKDMQCLHTVNGAGGDPQVMQSQPCPGQLLDSPDGAQLHTVGRGVAGFPLQRLLDEMPE